MLICLVESLLASRLHIIASSIIEPEELPLPSAERYWSVQKPNMALMLLMVPLWLGATSVLPL